MIVPMRKVYLAARRADRDRLLEALRHLGLVHLQAVDAARAVADDETVAAIARLRRALQILANTRAAGEPLALSPAAAADEVLRIQRESVERSNRLSSLYHQLEQLALWGDLRLSQFDDLRAAGIEPEFFAVPRDKVGEIRADCVQPLGPWPGKRTLVAVINRPGEVEPPEGSQAIPLPSRDRPGIRAEAAEIDATLKADATKLARLVHHVGPIEAESAKLRERAAWTVATRSSLDGEHLYALRGWVPADQADRLAPDLAAQGVEAAVEARDPEPGEEPPTLIKYPWWARPMEGLFKILGTVPGYAEFDVSAMFMIFLPVFSAILISDAGYGLLYLVLPIIFYRKLASMGAAPLAQLIIVIGVLSLIWGIVTCSFFGFDISALFGRQAPFIAVNMTKESMDLLMVISITLGAIQLSLAHLWKAKAQFPRLSFLCEIGWAGVLWGMYGVVKMFLVGSPASWDEYIYHTVYPYLGGAGIALAVIFAAPDRNPLKMIGLGLANFPLSFIGTFGDTVSYVRLMAIGLAGCALAGAFNDMGGRLPWFGMIPVLMAGHAMNVSLSIISLFAHGVRLNILEFSNNLGMQWSGYSYEPFSSGHGQES
jgi:V/A-type H+-transporting ATPase subunit I